MKYRLRVDGDFLLYWQPGGETRGVASRSHVAVIHILSTREGTTHAHVYLSGAQGHKPVLRAAVSPADADAVLAWFYGTAFPPADILAIESPDAFKAAFAAWLEEKNAP